MATKSLLKAASVEFISTCFFVWVGTGTVVSVLSYTTAQEGTTTSEGVETVKVSTLTSTGTNPAMVGAIMPISFAFGFCIALLVYATAHLSGGHINPAVTFGLLLAQQITALKAFVYICAQLSGAVLGSAILLGCIGTSDGIVQWDLGANNVNHTLIGEGNAFLLEVMGTFLLMFTVLLTAVDKKGTAGNMAPFAIGCAVCMAHLVLIHFTGCGINPARSFGPHVVNSLNGRDTWAQGCWVYYTAPFVGAGLAVAVSKIYIESGDEAIKEEGEKEKKGDRELVATSDDGAAASV